MYKFVTSTLKYLVKFFYTFHMHKIPNVCIVIRSKSETPFSPRHLRKLAGQPLHPSDAQEATNNKAFSDIWGQRQTPTRHPGGIKRKSLCKSHSLVMSEVHIFKSNTILRSPILDDWIEVWSRLIKLWRRHFIPLSWNIFSFTSSLGGAGGAAGGFGLSFGFSGTFFSGSGLGSGSWKSISGALVSINVI